MAASGHRTRVDLVRHDEELRAAAGEMSRQLEANVVRAPVGPWRPPPEHHLLVLRGVLLRELAVAGARTAEVIGPGDVIRPRELEEGASSIETTIAWQVLDPAALALLVGAQRPTVTTALRRLAAAGALERLSSRAWLLVARPEQPARRAS